jgi:hypothetical protein
MWGYQASELKEINEMLNVALANLKQTVAHLKRVDANLDLAIKLAKTQPATRPDKMNWNSE